MESTTHQIFVTSKLRTKYPDYFTNSTNQKYVSILAVYLFKDDENNSPQTSTRTTTLTTPTGNIGVDPETGERTHLVRCDSDVCDICGEQVNDPDKTGVDQTTGIKIKIAHIRDMMTKTCNSCGKYVSMVPNLNVIKPSDYVPPTPTPPEETTADSTFSILQYCQLHADFVQDDECLEQYVCMANLPLYHKRKYKQYNNPRYFNVWFTDYKGTKININELDPKNPYHFVVELLLEY